MAPAIVHFLVGAALLLLVATPIALRYEFRPHWPLWLVVIGGLWGLFPDIHHISPIYGSELVSFHNSPWADAFAFHYTLDRPAVRARFHESIAGSMLFFLGAVTAFSLATSIRTRRRPSGTDVTAQTPDSSD